MDVSGVLADKGYAVGWSAVRLMPETAARATFAAGADTAYRRDGRPVQQLRANLRVVRPELTTPELEVLVRQGLRSYARYWCEVFRLPTWSESDVVDRLVTHGAQRLDQAVADKRGAVVALGHLGNWDHLAAWGMTRGYRITTVAERLKPEALFRRFLEFREGLGLEVVAAEGDAAISRKLTDCLTNGGVVPLLVDRNLGETGVAVRFFDREVTLPAGPAVLARRTNAVLLPAWSWYDQTHTHLHVDEPLALPDDGSLRDAVAVAMQDFANRLERVVRKHPQDWHVLQRIWPSVDPLPRGDA